jgi:hypothetical protein
LTMGPEEAGREAGKKSLLVRLLNHSERVVYYGAAIALIITVGVLFISTGMSLMAVFDEGPLETALAVLDRVLLIFIFVGLFPSY